jgi:hypothetical protein
LLVIFLVFLQRPKRLSMRVTETVFIVRRSLKGHYQIVHFSMLLVLTTGTSSRYYSFGFTY